MRISVDSVVSRITSKGIDLVVDGRNIGVDIMAAIGDGVKCAICYYVGNDPAQLSGIEESIVICEAGLAIDKRNGNTFIYTAHPQLAYYHASTLFSTNKAPEIHKDTEIASEAKIGNDCSVGPFCQIGNCIIGNDVRIESGVKIYDGSVIGDRVRIEANSVIGATGLMWAWDEQGRKIPCEQTGKVIIEDDVFIGSNITIVRGTFWNRPTVIGNRTMIAHGTMIGHGSIIGPGNHFANNVSIAGSVETGEDCFFGSGAVVRPHVKIPANTVMGAGAVLVKDYHEVGLTLIGNPARKLEKTKDICSGVPQPYRIGP